MRREPSTRVAIARRLAEKEHGDHRRKDASTTVQHLHRVARRVEDYGDRYVITAYLHDMLEDTGIPPEVLGGLFGQPILDDVRALTHDTERETYADYIDRLCKDGTLAALRVKEADLTDNMDGPEEDWHRSLLRRYEPAFEKVTAEIRRREGADYRELVDALV